MVRRPQAWLAILPVMGVLFLGACNGSKLSRSSDDKTITTDIQAKLFTDPVLKTRDVRVDSHDGTVTLSGTVGTDLERAAVERLAAQEAGVKNVVNTLNVNAEPAPGSAATPAPEPEQQPSSAAASPEPATPPKPRHTRRAPAASKDDTAQLEAYTNSVPPDAAGNPGQMPAPVGAAAAVAAQPAAPPAPTPPAAPPPPPPAAAPPVPKPPEHIAIPAATVVTIRMIDAIDSSQNRPGEEFAASLDAPIVVGDRVLAPRGSDARVRLVQAQSAGRMTGRSDLQLELINLSINGVNYPVQSGYYEQHGASRGTRTAETVGGGAVVGALLGGLLGRGKGAAIGSVVGAGTGTAVQASTHGQQIKVPAETKIDFTLKDPITVTLPTAG